MPTPNIDRLTNAEVIRIIEDYVHNEIHRRILKRKLVDGVSYERIAEEVAYSACRVKQIAYSYTALFEQNRTE